MGKLLVLLLIAAVLAIANPDVRAYLQPYVQPAIDPINVWSVEKKLEEFARFLDAEATGGTPVRDDETLHRILRTEFPGLDAHLDPWGTPYFMTRREGSLRVASAGADGEPGTDDDLLSRPLAYRAR